MNALTIFSRTVLWNNCSLRSASSSIFTCLSTCSPGRPAATFYRFARLHITPAYNRAHEETSWLLRSVDGRFSRIRMTCAATRVYAMMCITHAPRRFDRTTSTAANVLIVRADKFKLIPYLIYLQTWWCKGLSTCAIRTWDSYLLKIY